MMERTLQPVRESRHDALVSGARSRASREPTRQPLPPTGHELNAVIARRSAGVTRSSTDAAEDEAVTVDGGAPQRADAGAPQRADAGAPGATGGAPPAPSCHVVSGPSYSPTGTIPVSPSGGRKYASRFNLAASFGTASGQRASACEVRQMIWWDQTAATSMAALGGRPHRGFPTGTPHSTWIEDRDKYDKRYGHRSGPHSDPGAGCFDEYLTGGARDQANGNTYCGHDAPDVPAAWTGQWRFQLHVVDTSAGQAVRASSSVITINW